MKFAKFLKTPLLKIICEQLLFVGLQSLIFLNTLNTDVMTLIWFYSVKKAVDNLQLLTFWCLVSTKSSHKLAFSYSFD